MGYNKGISNKGAKEMHISSEIGATIANLLLMARRSKTTELIHCHEGDFSTKFIATWNIHGVVEALEVTDIGRGLNYSSIALYTEILEQLFYSESSRSELLGFSVKAIYDVENDQPSFFFNELEY